MVAQSAGLVRELEEVVLLKSPLASPYLSQGEAIAPSTSLHNRRHTANSSISKAYRPERRLLSRAVARRKGRRSGWGEVALATVGLCALGLLLRLFRRRDGRVRFDRVLPSDGSCEHRGLLTRSVNGVDERHRITLRVHPNSTATSDFVPANVVQSRLFHPQLSSQVGNIFSHSPHALEPDITPDGRCIRPLTHAIDIRPPAQVHSEPELFFALCTAPKRAEKYAEVWRHFMVTPGRAAQSRPPGCLVTDASGTGDTKGMARANDELRRQGLGCVMRDTSRTGQRYELRVLGLVRDAWVESELRRWRDGARPVDWFIFGDDDTWWSDAALLRNLLAKQNPSEDHLFGTFSETKANFDYFGRIAYGGGGIVISRALLEKMQARIDECAIRFRDVVGGDGMITNCAAFLIDVPLDKVVEEVPGLRQMDIQGDATGYLSDGTTPFLSLHHWSSWLTLMPGVSDIEAIKLLSAAAYVVGGNNFLRRWIFDGGAVTWSLGYAVTVHRSSLSADALSRIEWTWDGHEPRRPSRPRLMEGEDKFTFYLAEVRELEPHLHLFRHTCSHPSVLEGLREIDILWDARSVHATASRGWVRRWLL